MITDVYRADRFGDEVLRYARSKDPDTGEERLLSPHELYDPDDVEVGDEEAYKVSLLTNPGIFEYDIY